MDTTINYITLHREHYTGVGWVFTMHFMRPMKPVKSEETLIGLVFIIKTSCQLPKIDDGQTQTPIHLGQTRLAERPIGVRALGEITVL